MYEEKFMTLDYYNSTYDSFCEKLKPGARILEIGCGPGNITRYLLNKRPDLKLFGIDIAPNMVERARINNPQAQFEVMDCRRIDTLTQKFDGVISGFCLPYISPAECRTLIKNTSELLHDKGILYLSFVPSDAVQSGFKTGVGGRVYFYLHTLQDIRQNLSDDGFSAPTQFDISFPSTTDVPDIHTILISEKQNGE